VYTAYNDSHWNARKYKIDFASTRKYVAFCDANQLIFSTAITPHRKAWTWSNLGVVGFLLNKFRGSAFWRKHFLVIMDFFLHHYPSFHLCRIWINSEKLEKENKGKGIGYNTCNPAPGVENLQFHYHTRRRRRAVPLRWLNLSCFLQFTSWQVCFRMWSWVG